MPMQLPRRRGQKKVFKGSSRWREREIYIYIYTYIHRYIHRYIPAHPKRNFLVDIRVWPFFVCYGLKFRGMVAVWQICRILRWKRRNASLCVEAPGPEPCQIWVLSCFFGVFFIDKDCFLVNYRFHPIMDIFGHLFLGITTIANLWS